MRALLFLTNFNLQHRILVTSVVRGMCKIKFVFNMGLKPVLKIEPPADRRAAQRKTHFVRCAARARSKIAIYDRESLNGNRSYISGNSVGYVPMKHAAQISSVPAISGRYSTLRYARESAPSIFRISSSECEEAISCFSVGTSVP